MLRTLLESNAPSPRRRGSTVASLTAHMLAIGGAVIATASAKPGTGAVPPVRADTVIYVSPQRQSPQPSRTTTSRPPEHRGAPELPRMPQWIIDVGPHTVDGPAVDVDLRRLFGADSIPPGRIIGPGGGSRVADIPGAPGRDPATAATVDRSAAMLAPPRPRYPEQLRAAGVTGRVVVRLVVDTAGRLEPGSVEIRESSHDLFTRAVRAVLPSLRFTPAEAGGRKVRMLVDLPFEFRLDD